MRIIKYSAMMTVFFLIVGLASASMYARTANGQAYAQKLANKAGFSTKYLCVFVPDQTISFDTIDPQAFKKWNKALRYVVNPQHFSTLVANGKDSKTGTLRQRFVPSDEGTERVIAAFSLDPRATYELKQNIYIEEGFDWGGSSESGKLGFGLGGGSAPAGGSEEKDGFTARLAWHGRNDNTGTADAKLYLYSADRTLNLPYGDLIEIPDFVIPVGEWFEVTIRLNVNSELQLADGGISVSLNNELLLERSGIQWQSEGGQPAIDTLIFSSFHGGNTAAWSPAETVYAEFSDACVYD